MTVKPSTIPGATTAGAGAAALGHARTLSLGTLLVVDDQPGNLRAVSALLTRQGYQVYTATTGERALVLAHECRADLILLDMVMPGMDGFELLAQIKQDPTLRRLPVVFLTAAHDRDLLVRAFDAGAVDYVTKPFMPEELLARVSAHVGLKQTRDRLERVARERQELVTLVAHDLKNPLSSVLFASDLLRSGNARPERVPRYLDMIHESAQDALGYIRRYLEGQAAVARGEGAQRADGNVAWRELLGWLEGRYALQLEARGQRLNIVLSEDHGRAGMDGVVLRQVVENLVTNAMKYAPHSHIDMTLRNGSPGYWQLHVEDRGPGIAPARRKQLFTPFTRLGEPDDDGQSSGLGLSLARQILEAAGGSLWYEDREGGGARFVVEVPKAREAP
jgi:two-component system sensor histidine kinase/response regulator